MILNLLTEKLTNGFSSPDHEPRVQMSFFLMRMCPLSFLVVNSFSISFSLPKPQRIFRPNLAKKKIIWSRRELHAVLCIIRSKKYNVHKQHKNKVEDS